MQHTGHVEQQVQLAASQRARSRSSRLDGAVVRSVELQHVQPPSVPLQELLQLCRALWPPAGGDHPAREQGAVQAGWRRGAGQRGRRGSSHLVDGTASSWRVSSRPRPRDAPCTRHALPSKRAAMARLRSAASNS